MATLKRYTVRVAERRAVLEAALRRFLAVCRQDPSVRAVYVHGSFATGRIGPSSDVDLLVVRETESPHRSRADDLLAASGTQATLDVLVVTPWEFAERLPSTSYGRTILAGMKPAHAI